MDFGHALDALYAGKKVTRNGWNGKGMFIYLQPESRVNTWDIRIKPLKDYCLSRAIQHVKFNAHIDMKCADGSVLVGWVPSQLDMVADDWQVMSEEALHIPTGCQLTQEFYNATRKASEWLRKNGSPHHKIIISQDGVELVGGEMAYSTEAPD